MAGSRPIGLAALTVLELSPPDMVTCAADAGYSHIGLRLIPATASETSYDTIGDTPIIRETQHRLIDTGVKLLDIEILRLKPETRVTDFEAVLDTGARLGARYALVAGNDPDEARATERFAALCDLAASYDIAPCLEPMPWTDTRDLRHAARIVGESRRANCGILIDTLHFYRGGSIAADISEFPSEWFRYIQVSDAPADRPANAEGLMFEARNGRLLPGDGNLDLVGVLQALSPLVPISVEIPMTTIAQTVGALERARRALAATHRLLERAYG